MRSKRIVSRLLFMTSKRANHVTSSVEDPQQTVRVNDGDTVLLKYLRYDRHLMARASVNQTSFSGTGVRYDPFNATVCRARDKTRKKVRINIMFTLLFASTQSCDSRGSIWLKIWCLCELYVSLSRITDFFEPGSSYAAH